MGCTEKGVAMTKPVFTEEVGQRPLLVFDGDCGFCTASVEFIRTHIKPTVDFTPWQRADLPALGLTEEQAQRAVQWVDANERRSAGAGAVARLLLRASLPWRILGALLLIPPLSWIAAGLYRLIADNRYRLPGGTPACAFPNPHSA
ncbi:thiol-disulfide oxidoreductase DCC family protein [Nocardia sp. CDC160]|uniref:thiol-disulfide oxidoreductase DCC family protein n=1 Tax=Nocardia sp. CDC160 TaxID=3112166 RepID=UPI003FA366E8